MQRTEEQSQWSIKDFSGGIAYPANIGEAEVCENLIFSRNGELVSRPPLSFKSLPLVDASGNAINCRNGFFWSNQHSKFYMGCDDGVYTCNASGDLPVRIITETPAVGDRWSFAEYKWTNQRVLLGNNTCGYWSVDESGNVIEHTVGGGSGPPETPQHLFVSGSITYATHGSNIYFSAQGNPFSWGAVAGDPTSGGYKPTPMTIIDVFLIYGDKYLVLNDGWIYKFSGMTQDEFYLQQWLAFSGTWWIGSAVQVNSKVIYATSQGLWMFDGVENKALGRRFDSFPDFVNPVGAFGDSAAGFFDTRYFLSYSSAGTAPLGQTIMYDLAGDRLIKIPGRKISGYSFPCARTPISPLNCFVTEERKIYQMLWGSTGCDIDVSGNVSFSVHYRSGWQDCGDAEAEKRLRRLWLIGTMPANTVVTVYYETGSNTVQRTITSATSWCAKVELPMGLNNIHRFKVDVQATVSTSDSFILHEIRTFFDKVRP